MNDDRQVELLAEILDAIQGLRSDLATRGHKRALTKLELDYLGRLYVAICGARGSEPFLVRDLADEHPQLAPLLAGRSVKQLGRLFGDAEGIVVEGYIVRKAGHEISTQLWEIMMLPASIS